jgi:hypothetical protein
MNNINATLSAANVQAIKDAFATVTANLPFLVTLSPDERKSLFKAGPDSVSFINNCLSAAQNHTAIFPNSFDTSAFEKDVDLFSQLTELQTLVDSLSSKIDDTRLAVGGESMQQATQVYEYVKTASKTTPGLKPVAEQLGERFQKARPQKDQSKTSPAGTNNPPSP